jgi:hypothetical protein
MPKTDRIFIPTQQQKGKFINDLPADIYLIKQTGFLIYRLITNR